MENYELIIDFFRRIGALKEANMYHRLFKKGNPIRFAVIKVGGRTIIDWLDSLAADLSFLTQTDLFPTLLHGAGPQIDVELARHRVSSEKIEGVRVTSKKALALVRGVLDDVNAQLVQAIRRHGGDAAGITEGVFVAERFPNSRLGQVGRVVGVNLDPIRKAIRRDRIPVVSPIGFDRAGNPLNINADTAARALVEAIRPKKFILLTDEGGVRDAKGNLISFINIPRDFDELVKSGQVTGGMLHKIREARGLIEKRPDDDMNVVITDAEEILKELFTIKGSGTLLKMGSTIRMLRSYQRADKEKIRDLIEQSFGRRLAPGYFRRPFHTLLLESEYKGVAIVRKVGHLFYLDKYAVKRKAQGEGIGSDLWRVLDEKFPKLFWRARPNNPINRFYFEECEGARKFDDWFVFWQGLNEREIREAIQYALTQESTLVPIPVKTPALTTA